MSVGHVGFRVVQRWSSRRFHRISTLRFIPKGYEVPRVMIHLLSSTIMSASVRPLALRCSATGDSLVLLCVMLKRWLLTLRCSGCPILPIYYWPHLLLVIKYIVLEYMYLQEAVNFMLNTWLVLWLVNSFVAANIGHVLHPAALQGWLLGDSWVLDIRVAWTKRSLKFLEQ